MEFKNRQQKKRRTNKKHQKNHSQTRTEFLVKEPRGDNEYK